MHLSRNEGEIAALESNIKQMQKMLALKLSEATYLSDENSRLVNELEIVRGSLDQAENRLADAEQRAEYLLAMLNVAEMELDVQAKKCAKFEAQALEENSRKQLNKSGLPSG